MTLAVFELKTIGTPSPGGGRLSEYFISTQLNDCLVRDSQCDVPFLIFLVLSYRWPSGYRSGRDHCFNSRLRKHRCRFVAPGLKNIGMGDL